MYGEGFANVSICCGCLVAGRRTRNISDYWNRFHFNQILGEIPALHPEGAPLHLCWECSARLAAAVRFREQVKMCYMTLGQHVITQKTSTEGAVRTRAPRLIIQQVHAESIEPSTTHEDNRHVKTEDPWEDWQSKEDTIDALKDESPAASPAHSFTVSDDEELKYLIGIAKSEPKKRERKKQGGKKRRKKKFAAVELTEEEMLEERRLLEESEEFRSAEYRCGECLVVFESSENAERHTNTKHYVEEGSLICGTCACIFPTETALQYHKTRHRRRYQCSLCPARHASKKLASLHQLTEHSGKEDETAERKCNPSATPEDLVKEAVSYEDDNVQHAIHDARESDGPKSTSTFPCDTCSKVFRWKTSLRKHSELHRIQAGEKTKPYCDACRLTFTTTANLQKHVKTSSKHQIQLGLGNLKELMKDAPEESKLAPIEQLKSSVKNSLNKFACPHCDNKFQWKGNLLRHIQSHKARANGELYCAPCDRRFSSLATFQQHMKISKKHVSESDFRYTCGDCGQKFANKTRLQDHVDWEHLKVYSHKCPLCQKVFKSNTSLYLHKQVVHRKDNGDHLCDHCGRPFPNRAKLRSHITAMHTSEQPYRCKLCVATFSWHSCLSRHVKVVHQKIKAKRKKKKTDAPAQLPVAPVV